MTPTDIRERKFEEEIESVLMGTRTFPGVAEKPGENYSTYSLEFNSGGYNKRTSDQYDKALCLIPQDAVDFVIVTQPKEWEKLKAQHPEDAKQRFLSRLA